jgi:hypothetical protein
MRRLCLASQVRFERSRRPFTRRNKKGGHGGLGLQETVVEDWAYKKLCIFVISKSNSTNFLGEFLENGLKAQPGTHELLLSSSTALYTFHRSMEGIASHVTLATLALLSYKLLFCSSRELNITAMLFCCACALCVGELVGVALGQNTS